MAGNLSLADRTLRELSRIAFARADRIIDPLTGGLQARLPPRLGAAISDIRLKRTREGDVLEVQLYDKMKALELLCKIHGMLTPGHGDGEGTLPEIERFLEAKEGDA